MFVSLLGGCAMGFEKVCTWTHALCKCFVSLLIQTSFKRIIFFLLSSPSPSPLPSWFSLLSPGNFPTGKMHQARRKWEDREDRSHSSVQTGRVRCHWEKLQFKDFNQAFGFITRVTLKVDKMDYIPPRVVQSIQHDEHHSEYTRMPGSLQSRRHTGKVHQRSSKVTVTFDDLLTAFSSFYMTTSRIMV